MGVAATAMPNMEMLRSSQEVKGIETPERSFIKIPKSLFSAHKITKAISEHTAEMLTIVLIIRDIVQLSTINNFIKHSLAPPPRAYHQWSNTTQH